MTDAAQLLSDLQWAGRTADGAACCPACAAPRTEARHADDCRLAAALADRDATLPRWRHRKRGTTYREVGRAILQHSGGVLDDGAAMMVYRSEADGSLGVRAVLEFTDGRFERL